MLFRSMPAGFRIVCVACDGVRITNYELDVTPIGLVTAIITEKGRGEGAVYGELEGSIYVRTAFGLQAFGIVQFGAKF